MDLYTIILSPNSQLDFERIVAYISNDNEQLAYSFSDSIFGYIKKQLSRFPFSGSVYKNDILKIVYKKTVLIYYTVNEKKRTVYIVHVRRNTKPLGL